MYQVLRLDPEVEERVRKLLCDRILPASQKCLRLWKKGDTLHSTVLFACT